MKLGVKASPEGWAGSASMASEASEGPANTHRFQAASDSEAEDLVILSIACELCLAGLARCSFTGKEQCRSSVNCLCVQA